MKTVFTAMLVVGLARVLAADSSLLEAREQTVHVWAPDEVEGRLVAFDDHTVTVKTATGAAQVFDRSAIERMEVSRGKKFHVGITFAGAGAGALTGFAIGVVSCDTTDGFGDYVGTCADPNWGRVALISLGGAAVGALATALATQHAGWVDVADFRSTRVSARITPRRRGAGLQVALRF